MQPQTLTSSHRPRDEDSGLLGDNGVGLGKGREWPGASHVARKLEGAPK